MSRATRSTSSQRLSIETWKRAIDKVAGNALMLLGTTPGDVAACRHVYSTMYRDRAG
jgi:hypothetical protein